MTLEETMGSPQSDGPVNEVDLKVVSDGLNNLIEAANSQGRDWKLVPAVLQTIVDFLLEFRGQVSADDQATASGRERTDQQDRSDAERHDEEQRQLSTVFRSRVRAVVDSMSDDETASVMGIGLRQVRRRAHARDLHYFTVGGKRRFPIWQFDWRGEPVPGMRDITHAIPKGWSPERIHAFMTTFESGLNIRGKPFSPVDWLRIGNDASQVVEQIHSIDPVSDSDVEEHYSRSDSNGADS